MPCELSHDVRGAVFLHTRQMSHHDTAALSDADGVEIHEHHDVAHVDTGCQCLIAYHIDELDKHELLKVVGYVFSCRWQAYLQQFAHLMIREWTKQMERKARNKLALEHHDEHYH